MAERPNKGPRRGKAESNYEKRMSLLDLIRQQAMSEEGISDADMEAYQQLGQLHKDTAASEAAVAEAQAREAAQYRMPQVEAMPGEPASRMPQAVAVPGEPTSRMPTVNNLPPEVVAQAVRQADMADLMRRKSPEEMIGRALERPAPEMTAADPRSFAPAHASRTAGLAHGLDPRVGLAKFGQFMALPADLAQAVAGDDSAPVSSRYGQMLARTLGAELPYAREAGVGDKYEMLGDFLNPINAMPLTAARRPVKEASTALVGEVMPREGALNRYMQAQLPGARPRMLTGPTEGIPPEVMRVVTGRSPRLLPNRAPEFLRDAPEGLYYTEGLDSNLRRAAEQLNKISSSKRPYRGRPGKRGPAVPPEYVRNAPEGLYMTPDLSSELSAAGAMADEMKNARYIDMMRSLSSDMDSIMRPNVRMRPEFKTLSPYGEMVDEIPLRFRNGGKVAK